MRERSGLAILAALLALLLIAALIAAAFNATTEETRIGVAAADRQQALLSAESAIEIVLAAPPGSAIDSIAVAETKSRVVDGLGVPVVLYMTRLDSTLYWIVADAGGESVGSGVARRIGVLARVRNDTAGSMVIDRIQERAWSELF
jgi:type II secretory pathway component PulK